VNLFYFSLFQGIVGAFLEVTGLCSFAFVLISTSQNFGRSVLYMNGIFFFPIMFSLIATCKRMTSKPPLDGDSYEPYENEKKKSQREKAKRSQLYTSISFFLAGIFAAGGFGYLMYLVSY
jgi:hypothetical protein